MTIVEDLVLTRGIPKNHLRASLLYALEGPLADELLARDLGIEAGDLRRIRGDLESWGILLPDRSISSPSKWLVGETSEALRRRKGFAGGPPSLSNAQRAALEKINKVRGIYGFAKSRTVGAALHRQINAAASEFGEVSYVDVAAICLQGYVLRCGLSPRDGFDPRQHFTPLSVTRAANRTDNYEAFEAWRSARSALVSWENMKVTKGNHLVAVRSPSAKITQSHETQWAQERAKFPVGDKPASRQEQWDTYWNMPKSALRTKRLTKMQIEWGDPPYD